jgi:hypothetical protein
VAIDRKYDSPRINPNSNRKEKGRSKMVIGGTKLKIGISIRKIPKSTKPKIAIERVDTTGNSSLLILRDFRILSFPIMLVNPPEVPLTNR